MPQSQKEKELLSKLDKSRIPKHVAIIMDGNGRWAKKRGLPRMAGHRKGINRLKEIVPAAKDYGIKFLTLFAFSTENWNRPEGEIKGLFKTLEKYLKDEVAELQKNNTRLHPIGRLEKLPSPLREELFRVERITKNNKGIILNLALNYGGRSDIVNAVKKIIANQPKKIDEETFSKYLYTSGQPDPDLLIRTSGEMRISNFLLWQLAYSELWITPILWPDFRREDLLQAILDYQMRERRFGRIER
ncbi:isoprenyl transferase [bacterium]|nr:isoprenyl transferase [bacterium]MBU4309999.1 isoprenyl transferase [bacterium]